MDLFTNATFRVALTKADCVAKGVDFTALIADIADNIEDLLDAVDIEQLEGEFDDIHYSGIAMELARIWADELNNNTNTDGDNVATTTPDIATPLLTLFRQALPSEDDWQVKPGPVVTRPDGDEWSFDCRAVALPLADVLIDGGDLHQHWEEASAACDHDGGKLPLLLVEDNGAWWVWSDTDFASAPVSITVVTGFHAWRDRKLFGWRLTDDLIQQLAWA